MRPLWIGVGGEAEREGVREDEGWWLPKRFLGGMASFTSYLTVACVRDAMECEAGLHDDADCE